MNFTPSDGNLLVFYVETWLTQKSLSVIPFLKNDIEKDWKDYMPNRQRIFQDN